MNRKHRIVPVPAIHAAKLGGWPRCRNKGVTITDPNPKKVTCRTCKRILNAKRHLLG